MKNIKIEILKYWAWPLAYVALIFGLSSISAPSIGRFNNLHLDKLLHFAEYFIFALLVSRSFLKTTDLKNSAIFWIVILLGFVIAVGDEYYQAHIPGRQASVSDVLADGLGALAGTWIYLGKAKYGRGQKL